ncbi:MAG: hypothetical protein WAM82_07455 [Thermoanaerobaculia bacterium]
MKKSAAGSEAPGKELKGRVLARVLAEDLKKVGGAATKSKPIPRGDEIVNDSWKLADDQV